MCDKKYLTKATSRNLSIKALSKTCKIRVFIQRLDIYNLQTKIASFRDQRKLLSFKKAVFSLAVFVNANTENS